MLTDFFFKLKEGGVPVTIKEFLTLLEALRKGVVTSSLDQFYYLARVCLVKDEANFDRYDRVFAAYFKGILDLPPDLLAQLPEDWLRKQAELLDWLKLLMAEDISPEVLRSQDQHKIIPPLHGALLKNEQDVHLFERLVFMSRRSR